MSQRQQCRSWGACGINTIIHCCNQLRYHAGTAGEDTKLHLILSHDSSRADGVMDGMHLLLWPYEPNSFLRQVPAVTHTATLRAQHAVVEAIHPHSHRADAAPGPMPHVVCLHQRVAVAVPESPSLRVPNDLAVRSYCGRAVPVRGRRNLAWEEKHLH